MVLAKRGDRYCQTYSLRTRLQAETEALTESRVALRCPRVPPRPSMALMHSTNAQAAAAAQVRPGRATSLPVLACLESVRPARPFISPIYNMEKNARAGLANERATARTGERRVPCAFWPPAARAQRNFRARDLLPPAHEVPQQKEDEQPYGVVRVDRLFAAGPVLRPSQLPPRTRSARRAALAVLRCAKPRAQRPSRVQGSAAGQAKSEPPSRTVPPAASI